MGESEAATMQIKSVRFEKHPVLGDLFLDFCDATGSPFHTIVLAGENGSGKTLLLEALLKLFEWKHYKDIGNIYIDMLLDPHNIEMLRKCAPNHLTDCVDNDLIKIGYTANRGAISSADDFLFEWDCNSRHQLANKSIVLTPWGDSFLYCFLSEASINF